MKQPAKVLIIEDDPWFAEQQSRALTNAGFQVEQVPDGLAGIAALDKGLPSAVILDIFLPGPNAFVLLHEMQSYTDLSALPVILCTGSADDISLEAVAPYGVVSILDKGSMHPSDLAAAVRRALA